MVITKSQMSFKSLREGLEAKVAELSQPGVIQTEAVVNARTKMEAMLTQFKGICVNMAIEFESE
jgi:hypothetical protein